MITQEILLDKIIYLPETGSFLWKKTKGRMIEGREAGCKDSQGYISIGVNGILYKAHRLAFLYMEGYLPEHEVDHLNRVKTDNSWKNLREVSRSCNARNTGLRKGNTTGVTGVRWDTARSKWQAQIKTGGKNYNLGFFNEFDKAVKIRWEAEVEHNWPNCNSTSTAFKYLERKKRANI
ncbi:MAG: HNH endonuclease [Desulfobulbaceae bacterium]|nr:HNH endonuclease [Desulfobulbaceae bacterium]